MSSPEPGPGSPELEISSRAERLSREIETRVAAGQLGVLSHEALQSLMAALCRAYGAECENGETFPIMSAKDALTGTDVMIVCSALLKAANLQVFELGMWTSWTGR